MLLEDPSRTHIAAVSSVIDLFESTNQPLVQPTGRAAQAAQAAVVAVDESGGHRVLVVLTLIEAQENVIYASESVAKGALAAAIDEAMHFAESMGFILDGTGWPQMDNKARGQLAARLSAFRAPSAKEKLKAVDRKLATDPLTQVARLFAAFAVFACVLLAGCSGPTAEQREKAAEIHYDLGTNQMNQGDAQGALAEYLQAAKENPEMPQIHNALGLVYGFSLGRFPEAEAEFKQALELKDDFSEAETNYGAFLLSRGRFTDAIPHFQKAINNPLYGQRTSAECNLAWALYKTGATDRAIAQLRAALLVAPKYCKGWRQLGAIFAEKGALDDAIDSYSRYADACPEAADAQLQQASIFARRGQAAEARTALNRCVELGKEKDLNTAGECKKLLRGMGSP